MGAGECHILLPGNAIYSGPLRIAQRTCMVMTEKSTSSLWEEPGCKKKGCSVSLTRPQLHPQATMRPYLKTPWTQAGGHCQRGVSVPWRDVFGYGFQRTSCPTGSNSEAEHCACLMLLTSSDLCLFRFFPLISVPPLCLRRPSLLVYFNCVLYFQLCCAFWLCRFPVGTRCFTLKIDRMPYADFLPGSSRSVQTDVAAVRFCPK